MSLNNNDIKSENKNIKNMKNYTKEMLQDLLKKKLNQRLIKLEESTKEHISSLNYTSKYFKEFSKAIQQFSKFFEESEELKEKEKEITEKKENIKENYNSIKYIHKKSNESGGSSGLTKISNKTKQNNKKIENPLRIRSNTQGLFKSQQLKKQATNLVLAKNVFSNKIIEEKKQNKTKQNIIISPDKEKNYKSTYTLREGGKNETPVKAQKTSFLLDRNTVQLKMPKTEKRSKNINKKKKIKDNNTNKINNKSHNISENKTENNTEKENVNNLTKFSTSLKKSVNNNSKNDIKNKKEIKFNLKDKIKNGDSIDDFSKTLNNRYINKTIDLDDADKANLIKSSFSTKKKRKLKLNNGSENINDIKDIVKLVDNVHQNITKLLETNERLNNNKSVMISSMEYSNANKTFVEANNRSSINILDNLEDEILNNKNIKVFNLKKKKNNPNIGIFKDNEENNNDDDDVKYNLTEIQNKSNNIIPIDKEFDKFLNKNKSSKVNNRYQGEFDSPILDIDKIKDKENNDNNEKEIINIKNIDVIDIFKKEKKILKNILKFLKDKDIILFTSCNNYLNKERISFLDNRKEELLQILNLHNDETMETKIKKIKNEFSEDILSNPPTEFYISEETKNKITKLNKDENTQIFKKDLDIKNKDTNLLIKLYKIFFILLDTEEIYSILNENNFWKKCCEYLVTNSKGNIGDFIIEKISSFKFDSKSYNNIENLIKENKESFIKELKDDKNFFISQLIEESLVYCGVILDPAKTQGSIIIKNLKNNQTVINYLNNLKVRYFLAKYEEDDDD